jgi:hypothetical protein
MKRPRTFRYPRTIVLAFALGGLGTAAHLAFAGEADDLQRMIDGSRQRAKDLEGLDDQRAAREELAILRVWLDEAWTLRSDQKYDEVRLVLDRCDAQSEMIREKIKGAAMSAEAATKEAQLAKLRKEMAATREALRQAQIQKAALQGKR